MSGCVQVSSLPHEQHGAVHLSRECGHPVASPALPRLHCCMSLHVDACWQAIEAEKERLGVTRYSVAQTSLEHVIDIITRDAGPAGSTSGQSLFTSDFVRAGGLSLIPSHWEPQVAYCCVLFSCAGDCCRSGHRRFLSVVWNRILFR